MGFLFDVSEERYDDIADRLAGGEDVNQADGSGNTALHLAAEKGIVKMVEVLLKNGAYLSCANKSTGWTPLHYAAYEGHSHVVEHLLKAGAAADIEDKQGDTAESWALEWENYKCAMLLAEATKKVNREREEKKERQRREEEEKKRKKEEDEDDDDDDEEELSHWVLPQPLTPIASAVNVEIVAPSGEAAKKQEVAKTKEEATHDPMSALEKEVSEACREDIFKDNIKDEKLESSCSKGKEGMTSIQGEEEVNEVKESVKIQGEGGGGNEKLDISVVSDMVIHTKIAPPPPPPPPPPPSPPSAPVTSAPKPKSIRSSSISDPQANLLEELKLFTGTRRKVRASATDEKSQKPRRRSLSRQRHNSKTQQTAQQPQLKKKPKQAEPTEISSPSYGVEVVANVKPPEVEMQSDGVKIDQDLGAPLLPVMLPDAAFVVPDRPGVSIVDKIRNSLASSTGDSSCDQSPTDPLVPGLSAPGSNTKIHESVKIDSISSSSSNPLPANLPYLNVDLRANVIDYNLEDRLVNLTGSCFSVDLRRSAADLVSLSRGFGDLARISQVKDELVRNLKLLVDEEKRQLENDLGRKLEELDKMKKRHREEENRVEKEIGVLTEKMDNLTVPPVLLAQHSQRSFSPSLEKELTCVNCSHICFPPDLIFQCDEGDLFCQGCSKRVGITGENGLKECPECCTRLPKQLPRNKALEKMARKHFE